MYALTKYKDIKLINVAENPICGSQLVNNISF